MAIIATHVFCLTVDSREFDKALEIQRGRLKRFAERRLTTETQRAQRKARMGKDKRKGF